MRRSNVRAATIGDEIGASEALTRTRREVAGMLPPAPMRPDNGERPVRRGAGGSGSVRGQS